MALHGRASEIRSVSERGPARRMTCGCVCPDSDCDSDLQRNGAAGEDVRPCAAVASPVSPQAGTKVVTYHGYRVVVPVTWPVYDLAADPSGARALTGTRSTWASQSASQRCPAYAVGRAQLQAILVHTPLAVPCARRAGRAPARPSPPPASRTGAAAAGRPLHQLAVPRAGVVVHPARREPPPRRAARARGPPAAGNDPRSPARESARPRQFTGR